MGNTGSLACVARGMVQPFTVMGNMEGKLGCVKGEGLLGVSQAAMRSRAITLTLTLTC